MIQHMVNNEAFRNAVTAMNSLVAVGYILKTLSNGALRLRESYRTIQNDWGAPANGGGGVGPGAGAPAGNGAAG